MGTSTKPRKAHRQAWNKGSVKLRSRPWTVNAVFNPLEAIIDQLENDGTIDIANNGTAVFKDAVDGEWYDSTVAIIGCVEAFEIHERRHNRDLQMAPLRQLANLLKYGMPITAASTAAARLCLTRMRAETVEMTADYARQLIKDFQIMEELQKIPAAPPTGVIA